MINVLALECGGSQPLLHVGSGEVALFPLLDLLGTGLISAVVGGVDSDSFLLHGLLGGLVFGLAGAGVNRAIGIAGSLGVDEVGHGHHFLIISHNMDNAPGRGSVDPVPELSLKAPTHEAENFVFIGDGSAVAVQEGGDAGGDLFHIAIVIGEDRMNDDFRFF